MPITKVTEELQGVHVVVEEIATCSDLIHIAHVTSHSTHSANTRWCGNLGKLDTNRIHIVIIVNEEI